MDRPEKQITGFQQRMDYVAEVTEEVAKWLEAKEDPVYSLLDSIEVDLLVILGSGTGSSESDVDSTYIMHCSWPFECSKAGMYESLPSNIRTVLSKGIGKILAEEREVEVWVSQWCTAMQSLLTRFSRSGSLDQAIGSMVAIDVMLTNLWSFVAAMRLNPKLEH